MADITVLIPLVDGFEEIEAVTVIDVLRRAGLTVTVAAAGPPKLEDPWMRTGSHGIAVRADAPWDDVADKRYDAIVLPGGPGTFALNDVPGLHDLLRQQADAGKPVAAICAAPTVLASAGLLKGKHATCHPSTETLMKGAVLVKEPVVRDGHLVTSRGAGTAMAFALVLGTELVGQDKADELAAAMVVG